MVTVNTADKVIVLNPVTLIELQADVTSIVGSLKVVGMITSTEEFGTPAVQLPGALQLVLVPPVQVVDASAFSPQNTRVKVTTIKSTLVFNTL